MTAVSQWKKLKEKRRKKGAAGRLVFGLVWLQQARETI